MNTKKIATGAVSANRLAAGAAGTDALLDEAVTANKLAPGSVGSGKIAAGAVSASEMAFPVAFAATALGAIRPSARESTTSPTRSPATYDTNADGAGSITASRVRVVGFGA